MYAGKERIEFSIWLKNEFLADEMMYSIWRWSVFRVSDVDMVDFGRFLVFFFRNGRFTLLFART